MKDIIILLILLFLLIPSAFADTTFFDQDNSFIMGSAPTEEVGGGTTEETPPVGGGCLTNWICSSWGPCIDRIQVRNCTKERTNCYADLKEKPTENRSCSLEIKTNTDSEERIKNLSNAKIIFLVPIIILVIGFIIFFLLKKHRKRRHNH